MTTSEDWLSRFQAVFARAGAAPPFDHVAVTLATTSPEGQPTARVVLLRGVDARGFVFYTNYESRKGRELEQTGRAALCAYWPWIDEQIRVDGTVERVSDEESDRYFASRPRESQIGAWASRQSDVLPSRDTLERRFAEMEQQYAGRPVPRPPFWGGYRLRPERVEFWRAGGARLHDRVVFLREGDGWRTEALYP